MSRLLAAALTVLLLLAAVPSAFAETATDEMVAETPDEAQDEAPVIPCDNPDGLEVITSDGLETTITAPSFASASAVETREFLVDLQATSSDTRAAVTGLMVWTLVGNDYELQLDGAGLSGISENYQPLDPAQEAVTLTDVGHCEILTASAIDFLAPLPDDALTLSFSVGEAPVADTQPLAGLDVEGPDAPSADAAAAVSEAADGLAEDAASPTAFDLSAFPGREVVVD